MDRVADERKIAGRHRARGGIETVADERAQPVLGDDLPPDDGGIGSGGQALRRDHRRQRQREQRRRQKKTPQPAASARATSLGRPRATK